MTMTPQASLSQHGIGHVTYMPTLPYLPIDESHEAPVEQDVEGTECAVQTLYEGKPKCECCKNWVEEYPEDLRAAIEEQKGAKVKALVVRMGKNHGEGKPLVLDSVVVQNSSLKQTLAEVFEGIKGITPSLKKLVFHAPFRPFYFRWQRFEEVLQRQKEEDPDAAEFTQLLYDVLYEELRDVLAEVKDLLSHGVITYPLLWTLFEPGSRVFYKEHGHDRFGIAQMSEYHKKGVFLLRAKFIDWDGERFGYAETILGIVGFEGTRKITDLEVHPATSLQSQEEVESEVIARSRVFQDLAGLHYKAYDGTVLVHTPKDVEKRRGVDGRVMIDAEGYLDAIFYDELDLTDLDKEDAAPSLPVAETQHNDQLYPPPPQHRPPQHRPPPHVRRRSMYPPQGIVPVPYPKDELSMVTNVECGSAKDSKRALTDEELLLCTSYVRGYSLKLKLWAKFEVEKLVPISWNDTAFPSLLLPAGYKSLILSFVEGQATDKETLDDVIQGKGLGLVMLLVGKPGTGKTLTAEAVADKVRKPLYVLSAGELGQRSEMMEPRLNTILKLAERWDAVLLFDECDVFLQERSVNHLAHNEIVAVFLRVIEYYRGVLFMTTNRAEAIDRAFQSRIHLTLHYPELGASTREQIWKRFLAQAEPNLQIEDDKLQVLASLPMNGREVRNAVKTAKLLAVQEEKTLGMEQIAVVLRATREVDFDSFKIGDEIFEHVE